MRDWVRQTDRSPRYRTVVHSLVWQENPLKRIPKMLYYLKYIAYFGARAYVIRTCLNPIM